MEWEHSYWLMKNIINHQISLMNSKNTWHWLMHPLGKIKSCYNSYLSLSLSLMGCQGWANYGSSIYWYIKCVWVLTSWGDSNLEINITYRYATFGPRLHMYTQQSLITCESLPICSCPLQMTFFLQPWKFLRPSMGITCHTMIWHNISNTLLLDFFWK